MKSKGLNSFTMKTLTLERLKYIYFLKIQCSVQQATVYFGNTFGKNQRGFFDFLTNPKDLKK